MALTLKAPTAAYVAGDRLFVHANMGGEAKYPQGGSVLTAKTLGMTELYYVAVGAEPSTGSIALYDYATGKLKTFAAGGGETARGTDQSGLTWRIFAVGR
jgi:hypothetical protein